MHRQFPRQLGRCLRPSPAVHRECCARLHTGARAAAAIAPAAQPEETVTSIPPISRHPLTQPPSHRPPEARKSQLHRQYTSLLRSVPMILFFQHNNLSSAEWSGIRRELAFALKQVDDARVQGGREVEGDREDIKIQTIQTRIFSAALRVVEYWHPETSLEDNRQANIPQPTDPRTQSSNTSISNTKPLINDPAYTHSLSRAAHEATDQYKYSHELVSLLSGPISVLSFPTVSPLYLKAALSVLSPSPPTFPAPKRRHNPGYFDAPVQSGVPKLMLLGARIEGKVFDKEGAQWVGSVGGGMDELRAQLVATLQGAGASLSNTLESAGTSVYFTLEGRKSMLEKEGEEKS